MFGVGKGTAKSACIMAVIFCMFTWVGGFMRYIAYGKKASGAETAVIIIYGLFIGILTFFAGPFLENKLSQNGAEDKSFFKCFLTMLLGITVFALPTLIAFFPGTIIMDAYIELRYASGMAPEGWIAHYSVPVDELMYIILRGGRKIFHNDNMALLCFTGTQFLIQSLVLSYVYYVVCKINKSRFLQLFTWLFFALQPSIIIWGYTLCKDTMYNISLLLMVTLLVDMISKEKASYRQYALLILSAAVAVIARKNGIYVILLTFVVCIFWGKSKKLYAMLIFAGLTLGVITTVGCQKYFNVKDGYMREMISVPIQQTARVLAYHGDELNASDIEVLQRVFICNLDEIPSLYEPELSDPVKFAFAEHPSSEDLKAYFNVWLKLFCKYPARYIEAFLSEMYGYFDLTRENFWDGTCGVYTIGESFAWNGRLSFDFHHIEKFEMLRKMIETTNNRISTLFPVSIFCCCGFYTYILLYNMMIIFRDRKWSKCWILMPGLGTLFFCIISPVNAMIRYALPIFLLIPIVMAYVKTDIENN